MATTRTKISLILGIIALGAVSVTIFTWNEIRDSRIKVGFCISNLGHIPVQYADKNNLYRQAGIDVKFIEYENDVELANALNQGKIDIAYCSIVPLIQIHASAGPENAGFVVVAGASVNGSAIMVNEFSGIDNPLGLNGTNISIPVAGGLHELLLHEYLNGTLDVGLDILNNETDDVNVSVLQAGDMPFSINGTSNPPFNAYVSWEIVCSVVTSGGFTGKYLVESGSILENHTGDVIACSQEIMDNPRLRDMMQRFVGVHVDFISYFNSLPKEGSIDIIQDTFSTSEIVSERAFNHTSLTWTLDNASMKHVISKMEGYQFIDPVGDLDVYLGTLLNLSFLSTP